MNRNNLVHALSHAGHPPIELQEPTGASVVVLPYGGRVLGLFPATQPNLLWVNPRLYEPSTALELLKTPGWLNLGGDRTWVSPERDINVGDLNDPWQSYQFPLSIDPGSFTVEPKEKSVRLKTQGKLRHRRLKRSFEVCLEKTIRTVPNPLRYDPDVRELVERVYYAGFEQVTTLAYVPAKPHFRPLISLWDAVNLPAGGEVLIPTIVPAQARDYFEPTGPKHLIASNVGLRFIFDARERHKIAVRGTALWAGRAGYFRSVDTENASLVVRTFALDPSGEYVDTPWDDPNDRGYVLECYNDSGVNGHYGELEYHTTAIGEDTGQDACFDRAQLWGFHGPVALIEEITRRLLGGPLTDEFLKGAL